MHKILPVGSHPSHDFGGFTAQPASGFLVPSLASGQDV